LAQNQQKLEFVLGASVGDFTKNIRVASGDLGKLKDAAKASLAAIPGGKAGMTKEFVAIKKAVDDVIKSIEKLQKAGKTNLSQATPKQKLAVEAGNLAVGEALKSAKPSNIAAAETKKRTQEEKKLAAALKETAQAEKKANAETAKGENLKASASKLAQNRAITLRYALYDVASATRSASDALFAYTQAIFGAAFAQQEAFSQVEKTQVGAAPEELDRLFKSLQNLSTEIPVTFEELSKLAMLGAQLGIDSSDLDEFASTVARFATVTGVTVEDAALKFGKLSSLLKVPSSEFENLASSIAFVGVNGASTEAAILSTAQQIGAVATAAGLSASQVIGLASAFASLGVAPEEARGVLIPTMNLIDQSVLSFSETMGKGNEKLETFARISGMKSSDFVRDWSDKETGGAGKVFNAFVAGLGSGQIKISTALAQLGLDGNRTSKGLTALGDNSTFALEQMADAAKGLENNFLGEAFAKTADDINKKLQMLDASFQNLMQSAGGNPAIIQVLGMAIDAAKEFNKQLKSILDASPSLSLLVGLSTAVVGLTGAILGVVTVIALARSGMLALQTAYFTSTAAGSTLTGSIILLVSEMFKIPLSSAAAEAGIVKMTASEIGLTIGSRVATGAVAALGIALRALPFAIIASIAMMAVDAMINLATSNDNAADSSKKNKEAIKAQRDALKQLRQELVDNINFALEGEDANAKLQSALLNLGKGAQNAKNNFDVMTSAGQTNFNNLREVINQMTSSADGDTKLLAANLIGLKDALILAGVTAGPAMQMIETAIAETGEKVAGVVFDITAFNNGLADVPSSAGKAKTALEKLDEILQKLFRGYDVKLGINDALDGLGKSFATNGKVVGRSTEGMRANFKALEDVITAFKESSNGNLTTFVGNLKSLRASLVQSGVTGSYAFKLIDDAIAKSGGKGKASAKEIKAIYGNIGNALAQEQAKNIKTISDYVSDLSSVLQDAFDNRYGKQEAKDSITSAFESMKESAQDAKEAIEDAKTSIASLTATKGVLEYQLGIAIKYGDTLRANSIKAKLDKVNEDLAKQEKEKADATEAASTALEGNTKGAIANRAKMRELVQAGNDYLLTLANSGMAAGELSGEAEKLAADFLAQGKNLGFAESELKTYTDAFKNDFTTVVNGVPKDISIKLNSTDPALQAVKDFVAATNFELAKVNNVDIRVNNSGGGGTPSGGGGAPTSNNAPSATGNSSLAAGGYVPSNYGAGAKTTPIGTSTNPYTTNVMPGMSVPPGTKSLSVPIGSYVKMPAGFYMHGISMSNGKVNLKWGPEKNNINGKAVKISGNTVRAESDFGGNLTSLAKFATGGFVSGRGSGTSDSIPAMLSNGEYVIQANAVARYGTDFMNSLNQMQVQRSSFGAGGFAGQGSSVVHLSPEDRQLLRAAVDRPVTLYSNDQRIANSTNAGNAVLAQRGLS
jgi:TP901 family phage tail tape measure protein